MTGSPAPVGVVLRRVGQSELQALVEIAAPAYLEHYADLWRDHGRAYAEQAFSAPVLREELAQPGVHYWLIETGATVAGFMKCVQPGPAPAQAGPADLAGYLYLERRYVRATQVGAGLGRVALNEAEAVAAAQSLGGVWLRAMVYQPRVLSFYRRHGYREHSRERLEFPGVIRERATMARLFRPLG